jgi:serine/threonine-protein kinase HipA
MNGERVGRLERSAGGELRFTYAKDWIESEAAIPISLRMPLSPDPYSGDVVTHYFDNLLPDSVEIRRRMQTVLGTASTQPFDLLEGAGADCTGALQLLTTPELPDVRRVSSTPISDAEIARLLRDYRRRPLGMSSDGDFRISLAGAQEKTALLRRGGAWHLPHGATPTTPVLKLPIGSVPGSGIDLADSVEIEWLCLEIAAALSLPTARAEIAHFEDVKVLVVERFDRRWSDDGSWLIRLPQEDFCQALGVPSALKYEADGGPGIAAIMEVLLQSLEPDEDRRSFFRACMLFWMLAAIDGHAKNFSVSLRAGGRFRLTPLYDIMSAYPLVARRALERRELKMAMAVMGKSRHYRWSEIQARHWLSTARVCRLPASEVHTAFELFCSNFETTVEQVAARLPAGFPDGVADPIFEGLRAAQTGLAGALRELR